jgi:hypothetical protein
MMKRKIGVLGSLWLWMVLLQTVPIDLVRGQRSAGIVTRKLRRSKDEPVMDLATRKRVLKWSERRRLGKRIRTIPEDVQIVIADNVEYGFSPREISVQLLSAWQQNDEIADRGILILVAMEQNRIEMEFGEGLSHIFDTDWCHEMLISKALPWFRTDEYAMGLEAVVKEIQNVLKASKIAPKKRRGKWTALAAMFGIGSYFGRNQRDDGDFPPPPAEDRRRTNNRRGRRRKRDDSWFWRGERSPRPPPHEIGGSGWDNWSYLLGRATGRSWAGNAAGSKTASNVNVFYGGSPTYSSGRQEFDRTRTYDGNDGYNALNQRQEEQRILTSTPVQQELEQFSPKTRPPITKTKSSSSSFGFKPQPFRPMETVRRKESQNPKVNQGVQKPSTSSSSGGGASWSSVAERNTKKNPTSSSNVGGGASWSSVESRPQSTNNNKKKQDSSSSGTGGGVTW